MRTSLQSALLTACMFVGLTVIPVFAAATQQPATPDAASTNGFHLPPLPADAHVAQSTTVDGKTLNYTATVGSLPVRDAKGKTIAEVVFTAYTDGRRTDRPVTFAFNGGPGASSVYLNLGAIGPKRVQFGAQGDSPSDPATLHRQPRHLARLHRPGLHRSGRHRLLPRAGRRQDADQEGFYSTEPDIDYLSRIVYDWLVKNGRMPRPNIWSAKATAASAARASPHYLQTQLGVGVNGVVLVSPYLDPAASDDGSDLSPLAVDARPAVDGRRPSGARAQAERRAMAPIERLHPQRITSPTC